MLKDSAKFQFGWRDPAAPLISAPQRARPQCGPQRANAAYRSASRGLGSGGVWFMPCRRSPRLSPPPSPRRLLPARESLDRGKDVAVPQACEDAHARRLTHRIGAVDRVDRGREGSCPREGSTGDFRSKGALSSPSARERARAAQSGQPVLTELSSPWPRARLAPAQSQARRCARRERSLSRSESPGLLTGSPRTACKSSKGTTAS